MKTTIRSWPLAGLLIALGAQADGLVTPAIDGVVAAGTPIISSGADGLAVDAKGRLYVASAG